MIRLDSLVLYKNRPARVRQVGDKLELELEDGATIKVRHKDVQLLHPGPLTSLKALQTGINSPEGEIESAWEILAGETVSLKELAELAFGEFTPPTAWVAWKQVSEGLLFNGNPEAITAVPPEVVERERQTRQARAAEEIAWSNFVKHVHQGKTFPEDNRFLKEIEDLALGRREDSRVLRELGREERPENAHALLLSLHYWDASVDPYPERQRLPITSPAIPLGNLPDEPRRDLSHLPAFAIDDEGNQDPDDALSLEGNRLWVHIADAAALIPPDSPADLEARARGASLYLPEGTVPMLPPESIERLGLGLAETSPALSFGIDFDANGELAGFEIVPSWVRATRLSYEQVEQRLEQDPFRRLLELAEISARRRAERGAFTLDLPETIVRVLDGQVVIKPVLPLKSRDLVREAMLMAGEAAAHYARQKDIPFAFAIQDRNEPENSEERGVKSDELTLSARFAMRKNMKRSQASIHPRWHAGLGIETYARVTSPMRRYMDLVAHQQLRLALRNEPLMDEQAILERIGASEAVIASLSSTEFRARKHWTLVYLSQQGGWRGEGVLVEKREARGRILFPDLALETNVHLPKDFPLDTRLLLALQGVNLPELDAYFQVLREV